MRGRPLASSRRSGAQVEGGCGAVAVHIMPRFVLHNLLDLPLQCKQAGTAVERELTPGVPARPPAPACPIAALDALGLSDNAAAFWHQCAASPPTRKLRLLINDPCTDSMTVP